jgi:hypothetical protein
MTIVRLQQQLEHQHREMNKILKTILFISLELLISCSENNDNKPDVLDCVNPEFFSEYSSRNFNMGFSTWGYALTKESINNTYQFIEQNSDIYSEHIDNKIPWNSWINDLPLPVEFTDEIDSRISRKIPNINLALSLSLLNSDRSDLANDYNGRMPDYNGLNDLKIEDAYFKHINYLTNRFEPDYLIIAIEVNELRIKSPSKWSEYKLLMHNVKSRIQQEYPSLKISESLSLHNLYQPEVLDSEDYIDEIVAYANNMDFVAISFYPFFKGQHSKNDFQKAFDFLHSKITKPIAFSETSHLSEDLSISSYDLFIESSECEQNLYLENLLSNAQKHNYEYVIWWAHRDFYELWLTFPEELKDFGKLWRNTGLVADDGDKKKAYSTWKLVFNK